MRALSTRNDEPEKASRPWDSGRDGFVIGEGAGILILEELEFARRRGAKILAEVVGYGMSGDAYHITQPAENGDGAYRVMLNTLRRRQACRRRKWVTSMRTGPPPTLATGWKPSPSSGPSASTPYKLAVSSTKSMTGHLLGGAGGLEAGITALASAGPDRAADHQPGQPRPRLRSGLRRQPLQQSQHWIMRCRTLLASGAQTGLCFSAAGASNLPW
jgi:3-oxoacyl-[acyl-carrier-protein] synthase II